jgi:hypothetical protein
MVIFLSYVSLPEGTYAHDIGDIMEFMIRYKVNLCLIPADVGETALKQDRQCFCGFLLDLAIYAGNTMFRHTHI